MLTGDRRASLAGLFEASRHRVSRGLTRESAHRAGDPFQGHQGVLGRERDGGAVFAPGRERFPGGQPGGLAADPAPGFVAAADLFFEKDADDLGGVPPLGPGGGEDFGCGFAEVGECSPSL